MYPSQDRVWDSIASHSALLCVLVSGVTKAQLNGIANFMAYIAFTSMSRLVVIYKLQVHCVTVSVCQ